MSKTLAPGLRIGWLVLPHELADPVIGRRPSIISAPRSSSSSLAEFLERGELGRHVRRMRPHYRARREALVDALGRHMPDTQQTPGRQA